MAQEMGKPIRDGVAEIQKCALTCDYYADNAARFLAPEPIKTEAHKSFVSFQPLGVVLAVMPWNFPFWQVFRFAAPGVMAGNAAVMKLSSNVPGCALAIERVFQEAGFPQHLFRTLMIGSSRVEEVIEHPLVRAVTLTGSGPAGRAVAGKAGSLLKKTVLELGGSDPYLVLEDADLDLAATVCASDTVFGLGGGVITRDLARGERVAGEIESGCVFVNDNVRSDPRLPFGGVKESGYGRELSHYGIKEFVNIKTMLVG
jgi:succinate-semialdehyde dehydrogenase / glutarate-semialdehyde dehydrogenase